MFMLNKISESESESESESDFFDFFALLNLLRLTLHIRFRPLLNHGRLVRVEVSLLGMCFFTVKAMNSLNKV